MFEFRIVTIFPELFDSFLKSSLIGKAIEKKTIDIQIIDLRNFANNRHMNVDDAPYGGGSGMVMLGEPVFRLFDSLSPCHRVLMTPRGTPFRQHMAASLRAKSPLLLFCGRYEGLDERACELFDEEISLGDFVLNGGEVAAWAIVEAVSRLIPGVIGNESSIIEESHSDGTLEYPQYTRPEVIRGKRVPKILLSGDHGRIARWRRAQSLLSTQKRRPDLFHKLELSEEDLVILRDETQKPNTNQD